MAGRIAIDLGCGRGRNSIALGIRGFEVLGVDNNPEDLRIAENIASAHPRAKYKCRFLEADVLELPDLDEPFDRPFNVVAANEVLHNFAKPAQYDLLSEMRGRTQSGGLHLVSGYVLDQANRDDGNEAQARMFYPGELQRIYDTAGWTVVRQWDEASQVRDFNGVRLVSSRAHVMAMAR